MAADPARAQATSVRRRLSEETPVRTEDAGYTVATKRKHGMLEHEQYADEHELLSVLQSADEAHAFEILRRLRSGEDIDPALRFGRTLPTPSLARDGPFNAYRQQNIADRLSTGMSISDSSSMTALERTMGFGADISNDSAQYGPVEPPVTTNPTFPSILALGLIHHQLDAGNPPRKAIRRAPSAPDLRSTWQNSRNPLGPVRSWRHDPRLDHARASHWGVSYISDETFRNIICSYFVWDHPSWRFFDENAFLDGLVHRPSELPSNLLVHAVVAWGARNYIFIDPEEAAKAEHAAFEAAKGLWEVESDKNCTLATACAGMIMHALYGCVGDDKIGLPCALRAQQIVEDLGLYRAELVAEVYDVSTPERTKQRALVAWGLFNYLTVVEMSHKLDLSFSTPPPVTVPRVENHETTTKWFPWPLSRPGIPAYVDDILDARAKVSVVVNEISRLQQQHADKSLTQAYLNASVAIYRRLQDCWSSINPALRSMESATPQLLILHTWYHLSIVELFRPFTTHPGTSSPSSIPLTSAHLSPEPILSAATTAVVQLRHLLHRIHTLFADHPVNFLLSPVALAVAFETVSSASPASATYHPVAHACFLTALRLLRRMAKPFPVLRFALLGIQHAAKRARFRLPLEAEQIFADLQHEVRQETGTIVPRADWVIDLTRRSSELQSARLEALILEIDGLGLEQPAE